MNLDIVYTPRAQLTLIACYNFVLENWGEKYADEFIFKIESILIKISEQPYIFRSTVIGDDVRIALVVKHVSLVYEIRKDKIILLFFWDNRQDPVFS